MDAYVLSLVTFAALNIILALGLNLISGFCGQVSLGHAAFYGLGAYGAGMLAVAGFPFVVCLLVGVIVPGIAGLIVGLASLRVREDFLAITTMGAGFIFLGIVRKNPLFGGEMGIHGIPAPPLDADAFLALLLLVTAGTIAFSLHVRRSWMGSAFTAIAQDEDAARTVGIDVARYKLAAFLLGTASAGLAGAFYSYVTRLIVPDAFSFAQSITILAMVVIGGIGSTWGVVCGALLLTLMPELFRVVNDYKLLIYGGLLLLVMRFSPGGLAGIVRGLAARRGA